MTEAGSDDTEAVARQLGRASAASLGTMGYRIAAYPLTLLSAAARAMQETPDALRGGRPPGPERRLSFRALQELAGFPEHDAARRRYAGET